MPFLLRYFQYFYLLNPIVKIPVKSSYICPVTAITQDPDHRSQLELGRPVLQPANISSLYPFVKQNIFQDIKLFVRSIPVYTINGYKMQRS